MLSCFFWFHVIPDAPLALFFLVPSDFSWRRATHAECVDDAADGEHHGPDSELEDPNTLNTPTSKKKAAPTQTATRPLTKFQTTSQKTNWNQGSIT